MNKSLRIGTTVPHIGLNIAIAGVYLVIAMICFGCSNTKEIAASPPRSAPDSVIVRTQSGIYAIRIGDLIELSVLGYPEFQTSTTVKESGTIVVPLVGELHVTGLTKQQFLQSLQKKLAEFIKGEPEITVSISSSTSQKISVFGAVTRQDNYAISGELSLVEALSSAGGTTPESDLNHVRIIHNGNLIGLAEEVDLSFYLELGNLEAVPRVHPGDVIYVPKKENMVRSLSEFLRDAVFLFGAFRLLY